MWLGKGIGDVREVEVMYMKADKVFPKKGNFIF